MLIIIMIYDLKVIGQYPILPTQGRSEYKIELKPP